MKKKRLIFITSIILIAIIAISLSYSRRAPTDLSVALKDIPQDTTYYLAADAANKTLLTAAQQQTAAQEFLARYFAPWSQNPLTFSPWKKNEPVTFADIRGKEQAYIDGFLTHPGWGENRLHYSPNKFKSVAENINLASFPNRQQRAITIRTTNLRVLPTSDPSFANWQQAGEGYPFDYLQETMLPANTPILILQTTQDGAWDLVLSSYDAAWIKAEDIAVVDDAFIREWQTGSYVTPLKDHIPVRDTQGVFRFSANIGTIYPFVAVQSPKRQRGVAVESLNSQQNYSILLAVPDANQHAVIKTANLTSQGVGPWPLSANTSNITTILNKLLGVLYGWGEMNDYRDCSATTMNYFASLGIWLPRNSSDQANVGQYISFEHMSNNEKRATILKSGIPWLTLFKLPGHIVLYIGQKNGEIYIFHDFWGLHTRSVFGQEGRAIVGKTAITPIDFGKNYINVESTFLDRIEGMVVVMPQSPTM